MGKFSKEKGKRGERYVVNKFKDYGYNTAHRTAQYKGNTGKAGDIEGIEYIHAEVKFVENLHLSTAITQAIMDCRQSHKKSLPTVFHKKSREDLLVTMRFDDWIELYNSYYSDMKLAEREIKEQVKEMLEG